MKRGAVFLLIILFLIISLSYISSAPTVTLNDPTDTFNTSSQAIVFNATAFDAINLTNMTLYTNITGSWAANVTNSSPVNNTQTNFTVTGISSNNRYIWSVYACDNSSSCAFASANRTLTIDILPPSVNTQNANETSINLNDSFCVNITVTDNLAGVDTIFAEIYNTTNYVNYTMTDAGSTSCDGSGGDNVYGAEIQATVEGIWNYSSAWANDTAGNYNRNNFADVEITVDSTNPSITINSPTSGQTLTSSNATINISFSDNIALSYCSYNITNSGGSTVVADNNITCGTNSVEYRTISDGSNYVLNIFANDTSGRINITSRTFSVNTSTSAGENVNGGGGGFCTTPWTCTNWSACINNLQTRACSYPESYCIPVNIKPAESQTCISKEEDSSSSNAMNKTETSQKTFVSKAAVALWNSIKRISPSRSTSIIIASIIGLALIIALTIVIVKKAPFIREVSSTEIREKWEQRHV